MDHINVSDSGIPQTVYTEINHLLVLTKVALRNLVRPHIHNEGCKRFTALVSKSASESEQEVVDTDSRKGNENRRCSEPLCKQSEEPSRPKQRDGQLPISSAMALMEGTDALHRDHLKLYVHEGEILTTLTLF